MPADERTVEVDGIRYTARVVGPAPWNKATPAWKFWKKRDSYLDDQLSAEIIEVEGHPVPLRSRPRTAIRVGTLHSMPEEDLIAKVRRAVQSAHRPPGADMVALTRGAERLVTDWGTWNSICALLLACGYETEWGPEDQEVRERDVEAIRQLLSSLEEAGSKADTWIASDLRTQLAEFVSGGPFHVVDIG